MKIIKFRAWDKESKTMIEDCDNEIGFNVMMLGYRKGNLIPMQYTGIKDKNGKEIYEGDILEIHPNPEDYLKVEVIFHKGCFCYKTEEGGIFAFYSNQPGHNFTKFREVIGNIYEKNYKARIEKDKKSWKLIFSKSFVKDFNIKPNQPIELKIISKNKIIMKLLR